MHIDVKYLPQRPDEEERRQYLLVAIDRATRWVYVQIKPHKTAAAAQAFLRAVHKACPVRITKRLGQARHSPTVCLAQRRASPQVSMRLIRSVRPWESSTA